MSARRPSLRLTLLALGSGIVSLALLLPALTSGGAQPTPHGEDPAVGAPSGAGAPAATHATPELIEVPAGTVANIAPLASGTAVGLATAVDAFRIYRTEVTNAEFAAFARETGYRTVAERQGDPVTWRTQAVPGRETHPVRYIAWADADAYCAHAGLRLPTELEWERAARGDDGRLWPWGNAWESSRLNSLQGGQSGTSAVGSYPLGASPYGILDLAGNVWEWTASQYLKDTQYAGAAAQSPGPFVDHWVLRGGSWRTMAAGTQSIYRKPAPRDYRRDTTGFRCAGDAATTDAAG